MKKHEEFVVPTELTPQGEKVIDAAWDEMFQRSVDNVSTTCLLMGILKTRESTAYEVLKQHGVDEKKVDTFIRDREESDETARLDYANVEFSFLAKCALGASALEAKKVGATHISPEHILMGILHSTPDNMVLRFLREEGIEPDALYAELTV